MQRTHRASYDAEALLEQYARSRAPEVRDRIVEAYLYIAQIVARKFSGRGVEYDDLYQVAALALFKAIDRYDASVGVKFATFVTPTMVGEVKNYFRDKSRTIRMPRRGLQLAQALRLARERLEQELGRAPRVDELAERLGMTEDEVLEAMETANASMLASLDAQVAEDEDSAPLSKFLGFEDPGYSEFERDDMLKRAMEALDERQKAVVVGRFFENLSQREVAEKLGISQMTVSRAERQALELLRARLNDTE